jgi:hypothetical protein
MAKGTPEPTESEEEPTGVEKLEKAVKDLFKRPEDDGDDADPDVIDEAW